MGFTLSQQVEVGAIHQQNWGTTHGSIPSK
jgi:hypothetical protein